MPAAASVEPRSVLSCSCNEDPSECARLAGELDRLNRERQGIELATVAQGRGGGDGRARRGGKGRRRRDCQPTAGIRALSGLWPRACGSGLDGLPSPSPSNRAASARGVPGASITGVDLGSAVRQAVSSGLLIKGGGHAMAAGVTLRRDRLNAFRAYLEGALAAAVEAARREDALLIDGAVNRRGRRPTRSWRQSPAQGPSARATPSRSLHFPRNTLVYADEVGQSHMRVRLRSGDGSILNAIAFRAAGQKLGRALEQARGQCVHAAGTLCLDRWNGIERVQLRLIDVASADGSLIG